MMLKSLLLNMPWLYELVQRARDKRFFEHANRAGSFAQHGEDKVLLALLREADARGPYVDVGCNHPVKLSNSFLLFQNGWRGVCIDPLTRFSALYRRWRPLDAFVWSAVGPSSGALDFFEFEAGVLSTLDPTLARAYQAAGYKLRRVSKVDVRTLDSILHGCGLKPPLSLLSVDIEGHELQALQSIDLTFWQPALVCLEVMTADGATNEEAANHLRSRGYAEAKNLGLNLIFRRA